MARRQHDKPTTVLLSLSPPDGTTRYVDQLVSSTPETEFLFFRWRTALFGRYDVLHVHWPELMIRAGRPRKAWLRRRALDLLLLRARAAGTPVVRTVHNERPHEIGSAAETRSLARFDRATTVAIVLNRAGTLRTDIRTVHIPHGHYRDHLRPSPLTSAARGRVLYFGLIRPYKGVEELVTVFSDVRGDDVELRIVGRPQAALRESMERAVSSSDRVSGRLEFVSDTDLADEVAASSLVVLPYRDMHNSGAVLVALSLNRPVLIPDTPTTAELADEVGHEWIRRYTGPLTADILRDAIAWSSVTRPSPPRLEGRDRAAIGEAHARVYAESRRHRRARRASTR